MSTTTATTAAHPRNDRSSETSLDVEITELLAVRGGLHEVVDHIGQLAQAVGNAGECVVFVRDRDRMFAVGRRSDARHLAPLPALNISDRWLRRLANGRPVVLDDVDHLDLDGPGEGSARFRTAVLVPLVARGSVAGMVALGWDAPVGVHARLLARLTLLGRWAAFALGRAQWNELVNFADSECG